MSFGGSHHALNEYRQVGVRAEVGDASPHRLVQMMLDGALERVVAARGAMEARELALKGELIGKTIDVVEGLRAALDLEKGGELAGNLAALYEYITRRLLEANARDDAGALDECASLLRELQAGWRELGDLMTSREPTSV